MLPAFPCDFNACAVYIKTHILAIPLLSLVLLVGQQLLLFVALYGEEGALHKAQAWVC